jgi:DNA (cytosine-5)-methyltransferase 1
VRHTEQSENLAPTVIDLFSGAGGMAEGFRQAGFKTLMATDYDEMAAKTFQFNHPGVPFVLGDLRELGVDQILSISNTKKGAPTVVCGGPPCQGFSLAGQRIADDPRNQLFREFVRVVEGVKPEFFVFENVSGLVSMQGGAVLQAILGEFKRVGYACDFKTLNAAEYGVPQARPRFIIIGARDTAAIGFPFPTHMRRTDSSSDGKLDQQISFLEAQRQLTVWDALSDLPEIYQGEGNEELAHDKDYVNEYQRARRGVRFPGVIFNHRATSHSERIVERYSAIPEGGDNSQVPEEHRTKKTNVFKLHRDRPARTVTCNHRTDLLHPVIPRGTTVREAARLQSFDDDYRFFGNLTRKAKWTTQDDQVGNAVPPLLAKALADHIKAHINHGEIAGAINERTRKLADVS